MADDDLRRQIEAHGRKISEHEAAIAVLIQRAKTGEEDRRKLWDKKDSIEEKMEKKFDEFRRDVSKQHHEVMSAITANKTAASILTGERGAGKWILTFLATVILVLTGLGTLIVTVFRWLTGG